MEINIGEIILEEELDIGKFELGVVKLYPELENLEVTPTNKEQYFKSEKYGYKEVTVKGVETEDLNIMPNTENQSFSGLYRKVEVIGDGNLIANNIKKGTSIFGVEGTAELRGDENTVIDGSLVQNRIISTNDNIISQIITKFPDKIDISSWDSTAYMFYNCTNLKNIPQLDTSKVTNMTYMFYNCTNLQTIPQLDTSKVTNMSGMFNNCSNLISIPQLNTLNVNDMKDMFSNCIKLTNVPKLDTSKVTAMSNIFSNCTDLQNIPQLDTSKVTSMTYIFSNCTNLISVPQLDASNAYNVTGMFNYCSNLMNIGGLKDLGKAYTTINQNNFSRCTLRLAHSNQLTHESLMNVINNLYDLNLTYNVANGGTLYAQSLALGATNLAKLTDEEIAIATSKGWNVT